jgi:hypothetical protein
VDQCPGCNQYTLQFFDRLWLPSPHQSFDDRARHFDRRKTRRVHGPIPNHMNALFEQVKGCIWYINLWSVILEDLSECPVLLIQCIERPQTIKTLKGPININTPFDWIHF